MDGVDDFPFPFCYPIAIFFYPLTCSRFFIIPQIVRPLNAYLVVDVQNDFISGSLNISNCSAQQNGIEVSSQIPVAADKSRCLFSCWSTFCSLHFPSFILISGFSVAADDVLSS